MNVISGCFEYCTVAALISYTASAVLVFVRMRRAGSVLVMAGFAVNLIALVSRGHIGDDWYFFPMIDEPHLIPAVIAVCVFPLIRGKLRTDAMTVMGLLVMTTLIAVISQADPPIPTIKGTPVVASLFFLSEAVATALFLMAGAVACAILPAKNPVKESWNGLVLWGFTIFTLCQILGALWAFIGWSYPFSWSTRHLLSASIWCFYGAILHLRYISMDTKAKALLTIPGIIPVVFMVYHHEITILLGGVP